MRPLTIGVADEEVVVVVAAGAVADVTFFCKAVDEACELLILRYFLHK